MLTVLLTLAAAPAFAKSSVPDTVATIQSAVGDSLSLAGKVVYVDFWASWCIPCRESMPWMDGMDARYHARGLRVVTINLDKHTDAAHAFLDKMNVRLPVVYDPNGKLAKLYDLQVMPTSFVYGRDGKLKATHEGFHSDDLMAREAEIEALLGKEKTQ